MQPTDVVAERFRIETRVGTGGMGEVFRATDLRTGARVAVKALYDRSPGAGERFVREARVLASLDHPAVVRYVDHGTTNAGELFLAMEWLEGEDVSQRLAHGGFTAAESVSLATRVAEALASAHARGVVHRDVKPSNLFLAGGRVDDVRVLDFGIARHAAAASRAKTRTGTMLGTLGYMAPEQARGDREIDGSADVFSLGCVLFECLTGRAAFAGENVMAVLAKVLLESPPRLRDVRPDLGDALDALLARMLAKSPAERPTDAELARALAALANQPGPAPAARNDAVSAITAGEQQLLCVVAARGALQPARMDTSTDAQADALSATVTREDLDAGLRAIHAIARAFRAQIERLADGSLVAVLPPEGAATDRVAQAARCALALRDKLPGTAPVVATGRGVLGERAPVGEVIDAAARMLQALPDHTPKGISPVRVDEVTAGLLDATRFEVAWEREGPELRGERGTGEGVRQLLGRPTPYVGRERDLEQLEAIFTECFDEPRAAAVLVTAPAGYGKSRLLQELLRRLRERETPPEVWTARGDAMTAGAALGMLGQAVRSAAGIVGSEPVGVRAGKLRDRVARAVGDDEVDRVAPFLGEAAGVEFPEHASPQFASARRDPGRMGELLARAWEDWVLGEVSARPVLLVLEDLHWGDAPTVRLVDAALRALGDRPFAVLALARPEVHQTFPGLWAERRAHEVRLSELTRAAGEKLVRAVLGDAADSATVARLVAQAGGNAFYLEELIRAAAEGRGGSLPQTVLAMAQARIEAFEPAARRALRAASVFGETFWESALVELLGHDTAGSVAATLDALVGKEAVVRRPNARFRGQREYAFRHALVREAAYGMFTDEDRALAHRLAGAWLEAHGEQNALSLAEHFRRGGDRARAGEWFYRAAERALAGADPRGVVDPAERAIECGVADQARGELLSMQAHAHNWVPSPVEAQRCAREALPLLPRGSPWFARAACELAQSRSIVNDVPGLLETAAVLREVRVEDDPRGVAVPFGTALTQFGFTGQLDVMRSFMPTIERLEALLSPDDLAARAPIGLFRMTYDVIHGRPEDAFARYQDVVRGFESAGDARSAAVTLFGATQATTGLGLWNEVDRLGERAYERMTRVGLVAMASGAMTYRALAWAHDGDFARSEPMIRKLVAQAVALGIPPVEQANRMSLAWILELKGDLAGALDEVMKIAGAPFGWTPVLNDARAHAAHLLLDTGRPAEALAMCDAVLAQTAGGVMFASGLAEVTRAEALEALGRHEEARVEFERAHQVMTGRAAKLGPAWREGFLTGVPWNKRLVERVASWSR